VFCQLQGTNSLTILGRLDYITPNYRHVNLTLVLTFICLRATTLSYDVAHRTVRSWRQKSFDCFSRWLWNTLRNYMCGVSLVAGRSRGKRYTMRRMERGLWRGGGGGRETVNRKRKISAVFLQPIQNPSYMSHVLLICITFICAPKTYKWLGTFIIKDGRYKFTFFTEKLNRCILTVIDWNACVIDPRKCSIYLPKFFILSCLFKIIKDFCIIGNKNKRCSFCLTVEASDHGYVLHTRRIHVTRYRIRYDMI
jgi:hypothetical protein